MRAHMIGEKRPIDLGIDSAEKNIAENMTPGSGPQAERTSLTRFIKSWVGRILGMERHGLLVRTIRDRGPGNGSTDFTRRVWPCPTTSPYRFHAVLRKRLVVS